MFSISIPATGLMLAFGTVVGILDVEDGLHAATAIKIVKAKIFCMNELQIQDYMVATCLNKFGSSATIIFKKSLDEFV
ncbi:MAG: hypothetical protein RMX54_11375 [Planktomarina sp.]|nr:hypothetical protein [Planktomarina sp.]